MGIKIIANMADKIPEKKPAPTKNIKSRNKLGD
jgi:hypothetical protein